MPLQEERPPTALALGLDPRQEMGPCSPPPLAEGRLRLHPAMGCHQPERPHLILATLAICLATAWAGGPEREAAPRPAE